jgi:GNAT superfamily N-acetyltransferase
MLINRIDENLFEFYGFAAEAAGKRAVSAQGFSYVDLRPSPWTNTVYGLDFTAGQASPSALAEGIRAEIVPNNIRVGPTSRPANAEELLLGAGFARGRLGTGMTLDMRLRVRVRAPADLSLGPLEGQADFLGLARVVVAELFGKGPETAPAFASLLGLMNRKRAFGVLGTVLGEPASAAFAFIDGAGVGGVYFVATDARMRGRGYGAATVSAILDELEERKVGYAILHATDLGKPVYERLGFEGTCRLPQFWLSP